MPPKTTSSSQQALPNRTQLKPQEPSERNGVAPASADATRARRGASAAGRVVPVIPLTPEPTAAPSAPTPTAAPRSRANSVTRPSRASAEKNSAMRRRSHSTVDAAPMLDGSTSDANRTAPKIRFSATSGATTGSGSRRASVVTLPSPSHSTQLLQQTRTKSDGDATPLDTTMNSTTLTAVEGASQGEDTPLRRRSRGLSVASAVSASQVLLRPGETDASRTRGHPFGLHNTSPRRTSSPSPQRSGTEATGDVLAATTTTVASAGDDERTAARSVGRIANASHTPTRASLGRDGSTEAPERDAKSSSPPIATPPHARREQAPLVVAGVGSNSNHNDDYEDDNEDDEDYDMEMDDAVLLMDTTGHSPIPLQLQRRVAREQRRERERIRRRINPSARTLRLSARLRGPTEPSEGRGSIYGGTSLPREQVSLDQDLVANVVPPSPRVGRAAATRTTTTTASTATTELPKPDAAVPQPAAHSTATAPRSQTTPTIYVTAPITEDADTEPEPTPPTPSAAPASTSVSRVVKTRPQQPPSLSSSTVASSTGATSGSRHPSLTQATTTTTEDSREPRPTLNAPVAYAPRSAIRASTAGGDDGPEPSTAAALPRPVPPSPGAATRVAMKAPDNSTRDAAPTETTTVAPDPAEAPPGVTAVAPTTLGDSRRDSVSTPRRVKPVTSIFIKSKIRRKPGATMTRLTRDASPPSPPSPSRTATARSKDKAIASARQSTTTTATAPPAVPQTATPVVAASATPPVPPATSPARVMKAPDSILQAASDNLDASPMRSVGIVPSMSAGQDLLPPLHPSDRQRTFTIVLDLDETMCNNRTLGPALLRPGVLAMLDDLRSLCPPPQYVSADAAKVSATTRLYEQAVARQLGCGPASSARGHGSRRSSVSPPATAPGTALYTPTWSEAEKAVGPKVELVVWTASVESIASPVIALLDPDANIFDHCIFRDPRWYREVSYTKDLRRLGRPMEHITIVENAPSAVSLNRANAILVNDFVNSRSDRQLYAVRTILRDWIEQARLSVRLPPRPIGSTDADVAVLVANDCVRHREAVADPTTTTTTTAATPALPSSSRRASAAVNGPTNTNGVLSLSGTPRGEVTLQNINAFLMHHPYMNGATGYVSVAAVRQAIHAYKDEVPRRRERGSRGSHSRSGSGLHHALGPAPVPVPAASHRSVLSKGTRAALKKKTTAQPSVMTSSKAVLPESWTQPAPSATNTTTATPTATNSSASAPAGAAASTDKTAGDSVSGVVDGGADKTTAPSRTRRRGETSDMPPTVPTPPPEASALANARAKHATGTRPAVASTAGTRPRPATTTTAGATTAAASRTATSAAPSAATRTRSGKRTTTRPGWVS